MLGKLAVIVGVVLGPAVLRPARAPPIPVQELERRVGELGVRDRPVVIYCRSGRRSAAAKQMLDKAGFKSVRDLGPMTAW